jgi:alpha-N-arabinofuranosidase
MREVDPNIICISSGNAGPWSTGLLRGCADHMDFIAEHFYCQERPSLAAHMRQIPDNIRRKAEFHRNARQELPQLKGKNIRIAMTEWNYWYGPHVFGELGTRYFLKDALGIAAGVHEYARQSDIIESAFYAQRSTSSAASRPAAAMPPSKPPAWC